MSTETPLYRLKPDARRLAAAHRAGIRADLGTPLDAPRFVELEVNALRGAGRTERVRGYALAIAGQRTGAAAGYVDVLVLSTPADGVLAYSLATVASIAPAEALR